MGTIRQDLDASVHRAVRAGVDRSRIVVDPGLGFGKRKEQNAEILARLALSRRSNFHWWWALAKVVPAATGDSLQTALCNARRRPP